jgi:hypothetical protein
LPDKLHVVLLLLLIMLNLIVLAGGLNGNRGPEARRVGHGTARGEGRHLLSRGRLRR